MYNNLLIFRNELKNKVVSNYKLIGIISELILSKLIFKKNSDIGFFLKEIFAIEYKEYIMKSRTSILAHTIRKISNNDIDFNKKKLLDFINDKIEEIKKQDNIIDKKNDFNGWIK